MATASGARYWGAMRLARGAVIIAGAGSRLASAAVLLGETLTGMQLAGAVLIMAGLYINVFGFRVRRTARVSG